MCKPEIVAADVFYTPLSICSSKQHFNLQKTLFVGCRVSLSKPELVLPRLQKSQVTEKSFSLDYISLNKTPTLFTTN